MSIYEIAETHFGVEDFDKATRYLEDFGVPLVERDGDRFSKFELPNGTVISIRKLGDPALPASKLQGPGVHELIWGVHETADLERIRKELSKDMEVMEGDDGVLRFLAPFGVAMGFKVFKSRPVQSTVSPANAPGDVNRMNQWRKWRKRALPKEMEHIVYNVPDVNGALDFMRARLGFRVTDVQHGLGIFLRAPGSIHHHNIAFVDSDIPPLNSVGKVTFNHINLMCDDIDEIMAGKMYLERKGWEKSPIGLGRHRISSGAFCYFPSPLGGDIEYGADIDRIDDSWIPLIWEQTFGYILFGHNLPPALAEEEPEYAVTFVDDPETVRHTPFKEYMAAKQQKATAAE